MKSYEPQQDYFDEKSARKWVSFGKSNNNPPQQANNGKKPTKFTLAGWLVVISCLAIGIAVAVFFAPDDFDFGERRIIGHLGLIALPGILAGIGFLVVAFNILGKLGIRIDDSEE